MITIEVKDWHVLEVLDQLTAALEDTTPLMADIAAALFAESQRQFETESGPLGAWPSLQESTKELRTQAGTWPGRMLNVSAGGLTASVQVEYGNGWAAIGSNKVYAPMQFFGGTTSADSMIPGKRIPARPFLPMHPETSELSAQAQASLLDVLQHWLNNAAAS